MCFCFVYLINSLILSNNAVLYKCIHILVIITWLFLIFIEICFIFAYKDLFVFFFTCDLLVKEILRNTQILLNILIIHIFYNFIRQTRDS